MAMEAAAAGDQVLQMSLDDVDMNTCHMSVEHVSPVNKRAALVVPVQHVHQLVPLFPLQVGAIGWSSGNLELDQIQGSASINH